MTFGRIFLWIDALLEIHRAAHVGGRNALRAQLERQSLVEERLHAEAFGGVGGLGEQLQGALAIAGCAALQ